MGFLRKLFKRLRISLLLPILSLIAPVLRKKKRLEVMNVEETLNEVFDKKKTIIRFGDGELRILSGTGDTAFQRKSSSLQERLNEVLKNVYKKAGDDKILLCMPGALSATPREYSLEPAARQFWFEFLVKNFFSLKRLFFDILALCSATLVLLGRIWTQKIENMPVGFFLELKTS